MKIYKIYYYCILTFFATSRIYCQSEDSSFLAKVINIPFTHFTEKLYVKTDKDIYVPGEQVWFKIWSFDNSFNKPLSFSKIGYIELLNSGNDLVLRQIVSFKNSTLDNAFRIPDTLSSGNYIFRAYTQWMRNFDPVFFCYKSIQIINPFKNIKKLTHYNLDTIKQNTTLNFYPEGGSIICGIQNHIVLKASDKSGEGIKIKGLLFNNQKRVMDIQTDKNGYCSFNLKPALGSNYVIVIKDTLNKEQKFILPDLQTSGITMHISEYLDSIDIKILSSTLSPTIKNIVLFSYGGGKVLNLGTLMLADSTMIKIPKAGLPAGLNELIVCDKAGNIFCRRIVEILQKKDYSLKIISKDTIFQTRKKVIIDLKSENIGKEYFDSDLSISVTRKIPIKSINETNETDDNRLIEMSYRKQWFDNAVKDSGKLIFFPEIYGKRISGRVFTENPKKPVGNIPLCLAFPGKNFQCWFTVSNPDGEFVFTLNNYRGEKDIIITSASESTANLVFEIDNPFSNKFSDFETPPFHFDKSLVEYIEKASINMQVERAKRINSYKGPDITNKTCFYGKPDNVYQLDEYIKIPSVRELIENLLSMVSIRKIGNKTQIVVSGMDPVGKYPYILGYNPLLLIDGVPVLNSDLFLQTNVSDIERIEIIHSVYYFGNITFDGVINLITRKGIFDIDISSKSTRLLYPFIEPEKNYNTPNYALPAEYSSRTPDFRTTLYWNPKVVLDKDGKAKIEFYTSDDTGEFIIDVEGYTDGGQKIKETQKMIVKK